MKKILLFFLLASPFFGFGQQQFTNTDIVCWDSAGVVRSLIREVYKVNGIGQVVTFYDVQTNAAVTLSSGTISYCTDTTAVGGVDYECLDTITQANSFVTNSVTSVYYNGTNYVAWDTLSPTCIDGYARGIDANSFELFTCGTWANITSYGNGSWYAHSGVTFSQTAADTVEALSFDVHGGKVTFYVTRCIKYFPVNAATIYSSNIDSIYTQNDTLFVINNDASVDTFYNTINTDTSGTAHIAADADLSVTNELITNFSIVGDSLSITEAGTTRRVAKIDIAPAQGANNGTQISGGNVQFGSATNAASGTSADLTSARYIPMNGNGVSFVGATNGITRPVFSFTDDGDIFASNLGTSGSNTDGFMFNESNYSFKGGRMPATDMADETGTANFIWVNGNIDVTGSSNAIFGSGAHSTAGTNNIIGGNQINYQGKQSIIGGRISVFSNTGSTGNFVLVDDAYSAANLTGNNMYLATYNKPAAFQAGANLIRSTGNLYRFTHNAAINYCLLNITEQTYSTNWPGGLAYDNPQVSGIMNHGIVVGQLNGLEPIGGGDYLFFQGRSIHTDDTDHSFLKGLSIRNTGNRVFIYNTANDKGNDYTAPFGITNNTDFYWWTRFQNGYRLDSNTAGTSGVELAAGASAWASISARDTKENFEVLDYQSIYNNFRNVNIEKWNYKGSPNKNIGIMAEDFYEVFGKDLGVVHNHEKIETTDALGACMLLIKAQQELIENLENRIKTLENK